MSSVASMENCDSDAVQTVDDIVKLWTHVLSDKVWWWSFYPPRSWRWWLATV